MEAKARSSNSAMRRLCVTLALVLTACDLGEVPDDERDPFTVQELVDFCGPKLAETLNFGGKKGYCSGFAAGVVSVARFLEKRRGCNKVDAPAWYYYEHLTVLLKKRPNLADEEAAQVLSALAGSACQ